MFVLKFGINELVIIGDLLIMAIAKVTKKNDFIDIRNGEETIIENPKSGGTDTLCFKDVTDISSLKFSTSSSGKDLVISTDETNLL